MKGTTEVIFYQNLVEASTYEALFELAKALYKEKSWVCIPFKIEKDLSAKGKKYTKSPVGRWGQLVEGKVSVKEYWKEIENSLPYNQVLTITGIGLITGKTSQITILDVDDPKTFEETTGFKIQDLLKKTLAVRTINGGYHFYFKYNPEVKTGTYQHVGLDIRNDRALAVIPP
ncbi:MAG: bifunctional DNA primase/polymerase [Aquificota bacterium]